MSSAPSPPPNDVTASRISTWAKTTALRQPGLKASPSWSCLCTSGHSQLLSTPNNTFPNERLPHNGFHLFRHLQDHIGNHLACEFCRIWSERQACTDSCLASWCLPWERMQRRLPYQRELGQILWCVVCHKYWQQSRSFWPFLVTSLVSHETRKHRLTDGNVFCLVTRPENYEMTISAKDLLVHCFCCRWVAKKHCSSNILTLLL